MLRAVIALFLVLAARPSGAMEPQEFLSLLDRMLSERGGGVEARESGKTGDGTLHYSGVSLRPGANSAAAAIGKLEIEGARIEADAPAADRIVLGDATVDLPGQDGKATRWRIGSAEAENPAFDGRIRANGSLRLRDIAASGDAEAFLTIAEAIAVWRKDGEATRLSLDIPSIRLDPKAAGAPELFQTAPGLQAFETLVMSLAAEGSRTEAGRLAAGPLRLSIDGVGAITFEAVLEGYDAETATAIAPGNDATGGADPQEVLAKAERRKRALEKLTLVSARLRFEDGALTRRLVAEQAQALGIDVKDAPAMFAAMARSMLEGLAGVQAAQEAEIQIAAFLSDPKSLTIEVSPPQPVPVARAVEAALNLPQELAGLLGIRLAAN